MSIRAVVVDIGGVLEIVDDDAWPAAWIRGWEERLGLAAGTFAERMAEHEPAGSVVTGEVSEAQMRKMYADALGLDEPAADELMAQMWDAYCGRLDEPLRNYVAGLRPTYTTAILSNSADGARREEQRRYGFEQLVDHLVYSHEVGVAKPDPAVFELTAARVGAAPAEIVFLDDKPEHVEAARALGWHAVLHEDTPSSIESIERLLDRAGIEKRRPGRLA